MMINRSLTLQPPRAEWLIIYDRERTIESSPVLSGLQLLASITESEVAHLYWMDPAAYELRLVSASSTSEDSRIPRVSLQFPLTARRWIDGLQQAAGVCAGEAHFSIFPETVGSALASLLILPLRDATKLAGILTLARREPRVYESPEMAAAAKLGDTLVAAMKEFDRGQEVELLREKLKAIRQENNLLEKRLAERKLVERAKGLLQVHFGWTEEDAYYHLRRTSRQQRTPMAVIAQRIIDLNAARDAESERLSA